MSLDRNKIFRISKYVSCVFCTLFAIGLFIELICMLWLCLMPDKLSDFFEKFQIWRPFITDMYPYARAKAELCATMLTFAFAVCFSYNAYNVFSCLEKGDSVCAVRLRRLSIVSIVCSVLIPAVHNLAFNTFTNGSFSKAGLDLGLLFIGLALFITSLCIVNNEE